MEILFLRDLSLMLNALGAGNCFLLAYAFIKTDAKQIRAPQPMCALLFIILGITIANTILNVAGYSEWLPAFEPINNALVFAIGPLLYLQISNCRSAIKISGLASPHLWWPYLFVGVSIWASLFAHVDPGAYFRAFIKLPGMQLVWNLYILLYFLLAHRSLKKANGKAPGWITILFWSIAAIWFVNILLKTVGMFFPLSPLWYLNITLLFTAVVCWLSVKHIGTGLVTPGRYRRRRISGSSELPLHMEDDILRVIRKEKYYRDSRLTIRNLSDYLGITYPQLSQFINTTYERNFNTFINKFRIEEVTMELRNNRHQSYTIMGLAQKAGFNSASAFYAAFKRETGQTPRAYLREQEL